MRAPRRSAPTSSGSCRRRRAAPFGALAAVPALAVAIVATAVVVAQPARRGVSLVVIGGTVITENAMHEIVSPGAVAIDGAEIVDVDRPAAIAARYTAARTI